jgi:hypothetical protein
VRRLAKFFEALFWVFFFAMLTIVGFAFMVVVIGLDPTR